MYIYWRSVYIAISISNSNINFCVYIYICICIYAQTYVHTHTTVARLLEIAMEREREIEREVHTKVCLPIEVPLSDPCRLPATDLTNLHPPSCYGQSGQMTLALQVANRMREVGFSSCMVLGCPKMDVQIFKWVIWGLLEAGISWNQITYLKLIKAVVASGQAWRREHVSFPEHFNGNPWRTKFHKESNGF